MEVLQKSNHNFPLSESSLTSCFRLVLGVACASSLCSLGTEARTGRLCDFLGYHASCAASIGTWNARCNVALALVTLALQLYTLRYFDSLALIVGMEGRVCITGAHLGRGRRCFGLNSNTAVIISLALRVFRRRASLRLDPIFWWFVFGQISCPFSICNFGSRGIVALFK